MSPEDDFWHGLQCPGAHHPVAGRQSRGAAGSFRTPAASGAMQRKRFRAEALGLGGVGGVVVSYGLGWVGRIGFGDVCGLVSGLGFRGFEANGQVFCHCTSPLCT